MGMGCEARRIRSGRTGVRAESRWSMIDSPERSDPPEGVGGDESEQDRLIQRTWAGIRIQLLFHSSYALAVLMVCGVACAGVGHFGFSGDLRSSAAQPAGQRRWRRDPGKALDRKSVV